MKIGDQMKVYAIFQVHSGFEDIFDLVGLCPDDEKMLNDFMNKYDIEDLVFVTRNECPDFVEFIAEEIDVFEGSEG